MLCVSGAPLIGVGRDERADFAARFSYRILSHKLRGA